MDNQPRTASSEPFVELIDPARPLRVAALVKQVPKAESLELRPDGRLERSGVELEMNPYCRRAVSKAVELARCSGGMAKVVTLGPASAEDVLREAVAWGADEGIHLCDPAFAGSDTLATARALAAALAMAGPFDLVLVGRNTVDGDTGQVGPEVAELTGLVLVTGARRLAIEGERLSAYCELDDGWAVVETLLPAVVTVAERLTEPAKVDEAGRKVVPAERLRTLGAAELGPGPWGQGGSPTVVGQVYPTGHKRAGRVLQGSLREQVGLAVTLLEEVGALAGEPGPPGVLDGDGARPSGVGDVSAAPPSGGWVCVVAEPGRAAVTGELLGAALSLRTSRRPVVVFGPVEAVDDADGSDTVVELVGAETAEDVAAALTSWAREHEPWLVLAPSTAFGREVAGRTAAALEAGLIGDALGIDVVGNRLRAPKPALAGSLVADISSRSSVQLVTVRPGVLPPLAPGRKAHSPVRIRLEVAARGRLRTRAAGRDDDVEALTRAEVVIGVGTAVAPEDYLLLEPLQRLLGAELAATRKVTDRGWMPRSRQVGITGRSIAPRLYVAVGVAGKFNHVVGVRNAGTVLAVNRDPEAPIFSHADVGIVGDWKEAVALLEHHLASRLAPKASARA